MNTATSTPATVTNFLKAGIGTFFTTNEDIQTVKGIVPAGSYVAYQWGGYEVVTVWYDGLKVQFQVTAPQVTVAANRFTKEPKVGTTFEALTLPEKAWLLRENAEYLDGLTGRTMKATEAFRLAVKPEYDYYIRLFLKWNNTPVE